MNPLIRIIVFQVALLPCFPLHSQSLSLEQIKWIHGSENCSQNKDPYLQVVRYNKDTWIFRQNKCLHYEAPFMYLFLGDEQALLVDTGARTPKELFPLRDSVVKLLSARKTSSGMPIRLIVIHSHSHGDHTAGDYQFRNQPNIRLIDPTRDSIAGFFGIKTWPEQMVDYDLGHRRLTIIPIPGHDQTSIAVYDSQTQWLLTGDSVYPGRLYVRDWTAYKASIKRLISFNESTAVSWLMGNHIEMSKLNGHDYPTGSTWHPDEQILPMKPDVLKQLYEACQKMGNIPVKEIHESFIIEPVK